VWVANIERVRILSTDLGHQKGGILMNFFPLIKETGSPNLPDGVMVLYEKPDVRSVLDFLSFWISYRDSTKKELIELPGIFINNEPTDPEELHAHLSGVFPDDEGIMDTEIATQIFDADRDFFEEYMNHLESFILPKEEDEDEDTDHPLWDTYDMFMYIELEFFPLKEEMH